MSARGVKLALIAVLAVPAIALAAADPTPEQRAQERIKRFMEDPVGLNVYREANATLPPKGRIPRIVFMGDSITQGWRDMVPGFFTPGRIGRGIGGQTTLQMLARFRPDVIDLKPDVVQIMAATNDIAGNLGPASDEEIRDNMQSMVDLAHANCIKVILASIPPAADFSWQPGLNPGPRIVGLNAWLKGYAKETGSVYADYWSALGDGGVGMRPEFTYDGVHPDKEGYAAMAPVAEKAIAEALRLPKPKRCKRA